MHVPGLGAWGREKQKAETGSAEANDGKGFRRTSGVCSMTSLLWASMALQLTGEGIHSVPATTKKTWPSSPSSGPRTGRRRGEHDKAELRWKMGGSKNETGTPERPVLCHARNLCWRQEGVPSPDTSPWLRPDVIDGGEGQGISGFVPGWRRPTATGPASVSWRRRPEREISSQGPSSCPRTRFRLRNPQSTDGVLYHLFRRSTCCRRAISLPGSD